MTGVVRSDAFDRWLRQLKERRAKAQILVRIDRLAAGHPCDSKAVGGGVLELRIDAGPGYRVYYLHHGREIVVLLVRRRQVDTATRHQVSSPLGRGVEEHMNSNSKENFSPFDSADYMFDGGDVATYLEFVLDEAGDDPAFVAQAFGTIARSGNVSELARRVGMSREGLYKALSADGNPSFATIMKVAKELGLKLHFEPVS